MFNAHSTCNRLASLSGVALLAPVMALTALTLLVSAPVAGADPARIVSERAETRAATLEPSSDPVSVPTGAPSADAAASASGDDSNIALVVGMVGVAGLATAFALHRHAARRRTQLAGR